MVAKNPVCASHPLQERTIQKGQTMKKIGISNLSPLQRHGRFHHQGGLRVHRLLAAFIPLVLLLGLVSSSVLGAPASRPDGEANAAPLVFSLSRIHAPRLFHDMNTHSLRLDTSKLPHIAYGGDHLYYASYNGATWQTTVVDGSDGVGAYASLALGPDNTPHISYYDAIRGALKYATFSGGSWVVQTVDTLPVTTLSEQGVQDLDASNPVLGPAEQRDWSYTYLNPEILRDSNAITLTEAAKGVGRYSSIAVDSFNHPSISYYDAKNGDLKLAHWTGLVWDIKTVDSDFNVGAYNSLALDSNGNAYISYYDLTNQDLRYARFTGSKWEFKLVDATGNVGLYTSIILDSSKKPYISYYDATNGNLKYARFNGTSWAVQTVDTGGTDYVGYYTSIGLNNASTPKPYIVYYNSTKGNMRYARLDSTGWVSFVIPNTGSAGQYASLAMDGNSLRISYYNAGKGQLSYSFGSGSTWTTQKVDDAADVGMYTSLAFDTLGNPQVSYYDDIHDDLKYAAWNGSAWVVQTVDFDGVVGLSSSLAVNSANQPSIAYYDYGRDDLKYAKWTGSAWQVSVVDPDIGSNGAVGKGMSISLALDSAGNPRIAYFFGKSADLRVALWTGSAWSIKTVDSTEDVGRYNSMRIDGANNIHVSYFNQTVKHLRYAVGVPDGSDWNKMTIDNGDGVGYYTSIAIDSANNPRISYFDDNGDRLKYASFNGGWTTEVVPGSESMGWYSSITVDAAGVPHISAYDAFRLNLRYLYKAGDTWVNRVVDTNGNVGESSSIAMGPGGLPFIAYYDATNGDLKFASPGLAQVLFLPVIMTK